MINVLYIILILWTITGLAVFVGLTDAKCMPARDRKKNRITVAVCGPIVWVVGSGMMGYLVLKKWLEE